MNTVVSKAFHVENVDISSTQPAIINADNYDSSASADAKPSALTIALNEVVKLFLSPVPSSR
jgi:hypothetical protein